MTRMLLPLAMLALSSSCFFVGEEGRRCDGSADCPAQRASPLECVLIEGDGVCLPAIEHVPTACSSVDECALFPVEATCSEGACQCGANDLECEDGQIVDTRRCACVESDGSRGKICNDDDGCNLGLSCEEGICSPGNAVGDPCARDEPCVEGFTCDSQDQCLLAVGESCTSTGDCFGFCVNARCDADRGFPGEGCADDNDCETRLCFEGTCQ